jgi:hypothetical protein
MPLIEHEFFGVGRGRIWRNEPMSTRARSATFSQVDAGRTSGLYAPYAMDSSCPWTPLSPSLRDQSVVEKGLQLPQMSLERNQRGRQRVI